MFEEAQLITILIFLFFTVNIFKNILLRTFISLFGTLFLFLELISYYLTGDLIDYRFYVYSDLSSINTFLFQFQKEFLLSVLSFLIANLILIKINFRIIQEYKKTSYIVILLCLLGLTLPNKSALHKIYKISVIYNKDFFFKKSKKIKNQNIDLGNFVNENNLDIFIKDKNVKGTRGSNIIFLSLESLDSGFLNSTPELTPNLNIMKDKFNYIEFDESPGCNWSVAALYCLMTGLPSYFPFDPNRIFQGVTKSNIINLGHILKQSGYDDVSYYIGEANFSGTRDLLEIFEFDVFDYNQSTGNYPVFPNNFGYHDKDLFYEIKKKIIKNKKDGKKFAIFASTINSHLNGIKDERMDNLIPDIYENNLEHAVLSTDYLVNDFIEFISSQNLLENTTLIITQDHLLPNNIGSRETLNKINDNDRFLYIISNKKLKNKRNSIFQIELPKIILDTAKVNHNYEFFYEKKTYENLNKFSEDNQDYFSKFNEEALKYEKKSDLIELIVKKDILRVFKDKNLIYEYPLNRNDPSYINLIFDKNFILKPDISNLETSNPKKISKDDNESLTYYFLSVFKNDNQLVNARLLNINTKEIFKLPINLQNGISLETKNIFNNYSFSEKFNDKKKFIAHAGGEILGHKYTNSLEALDQSYRNGFRYFELDMIVTSDNYIVASHDWDMWVSQTGYKGQIPPSLEEFKKYKILDIFTAIDYSDINNWFDEHKDTFLVTDKIEDVNLIEEQLNIDKSRIMIEVFNKEILEELNAKEYQVIPLLGLIKQIPNPISYLKQKDIKYISTSHKIKRLLKRNHLHYWLNFFSPSLERDLLDNGFKFYAFNLNQKKRNISELDLMCNYGDIFYGIYADKWTFNQNAYCK